MLHSNKILRFLLGTCSTFILLLTVLYPAAPASALGATSSQLSVDFIRSADCTGEDVQISGVIHLVNQTQADGGIVSHFNYQNVQGLGLTSGSTYQASAVDHVRLSAPFPSDIHSVQTFHLIHRGAGSNLLVNVLYHITVTARGEVTASIDAFDMQCT